MIPEQDKEAPGDRSALPALGADGQTGKEVNQPVENITIGRNGALPAWHAESR
jgi:hypothetical protein